MPINTFREHLTYFPNVKSFTFFTLELVYQVGGFAAGKGDDGISEAGVRAGERLGGDVDGTCLAAGTVAGEGSTGRGGGTGAEDFPSLLHQRHPTFPRDHTISPHASSSRHHHGYC